MFADRSDAGRQLARRLAALPTEHLVVLGLPRGGVPVAYELDRNHEAGRADLPDDRVPSLHLEQPFGGIVAVVGSFPQERSAQLQ